MLGTTEYYLVGFGLQGFTRLRGLRNKIPKALHEVSARFCKSYGADSTLSPQGFHENCLQGSPGPVGQVGARLRRRGPIGPRLRRRAPIGPHQLPSRCRIVLLDTLVRPHPKQSRRSAIIRDHRALVGPDCTVGPRPGQGAIALSLLALLHKVTRRHLSKTGGEVGPGAGVVLLGILPELISLIACVNQKACISLCQALLR